MAWIGGPIELLLRKLHATVSVAESCTGGMLGERLTAAPGSSDYFLGGFITYTNAMKMELLGVSAETLEEFGAVSAETAEAMARGARRRTGSTYALAVTGIAGPDAAGTHVAHRQFLGDRARVRTFTVQMALDLLRRRIGR